jgi:ABC-type glycerol-3-phosphate transport system permease component
LVYLIVVLPISVWLLKGFIDKIPYEMEEAAVIDGCSIFALLWRIVIPMTFPAIAAVAMYSFILAWNEFLFELVFSSAESRPVSVGLAFFIDEVGVRWGQLMAASILMSIPAIPCAKAAGAGLERRRGQRLTARHICTWITLVYQTNKGDSKHGKNFNGPNR